jgi:hypothetical protein
MEFVYLGFNQIANIRSFRFEYIVIPERRSEPRTTRHFTVTADLSLFLRCSVPIQEGPQISLKVLEQAFAGQEGGSALPEPIRIEEESLAEYAAVKAQRVTDKAAARRRFRPPVKTRPPVQFHFSPPTSSY